MSFRISLVFLLLPLLVVGCGGESEDLVVYSGRSRSLVEPLIERFQEETGLRVGVRFGDTAQLAVGLMEEGDRTSADVFWAQDGGALGALEQAGRFIELPDSVQNRVMDLYRGSAGTWVATSGRARTLTYSPERIEEAELPQSIFDLADEKWADRIGWAPTNGSFQAHVTAMRELVGDDSTRAWLAAIRDNGAKSYQRNAAIVQAIADGEIDLGLPNHYYLLRFKADDANYPVEQTFFAPGDAGNLVNVAGVGVLVSSTRQDAALRFISFLLSEHSQAYFANDTKEYPVIEGVAADEALTDQSQLEEVRPSVEFSRLGDMEATLQLMREVGIL